MGLRVQQTAPIAMTMMGVPVTGVIGRGVRTGDDSPIIGLMNWLHPDQFGSLVIYDFTPQRAVRVLNRATNQGGLELADSDNSWLSLVITPGALSDAFVALGLVTVVGGLVKAATPLSRVGI